MVPTNGRLAARALVATLVGIVCARLLFPGQAGVIGVVLAAFAQADVARALFDRNREEIYGGAFPPRQANRRLAVALLAMFLGMFAAYVLAVQVARPWLARPLVGFVPYLAFDDFSSLVTANAVVLLGSFLGAALYEHAGMLLVLGWNAARWGLVISAAGGAVEVSLAGTLASVAPHLVLEACAYILAAMAGVFLRRGVARHPLGSPAFARVARAVLGLVALGAGVLALAALAESQLAPRLLAWLG